MAAKTGPTPDPNADASRRVAAVPLREKAIPMPVASDDWLPGTRQDYRDYARSDTARALSLEHLPQVWLLFTYRDLHRRLVESFDPAEESADVRHKHLQDIRTLDGMIARLCGELGIGPLQRVRLGIKVAGATRDPLRQFVTGG
ncbi:MAG TPA: hypothetical protein VGQ42_15670 [Candidatus Dormibacteraeota bacterium]|jgi:hypothetical protein|nr:hypothetical protein [Candidatus Dormibacteraeota bacterium]